MTEQNGTGKNGYTSLALGGLWKNKDKNGNTFLSGRLNPNTGIMVFPNPNKRNDRDPDYQIFLTAIQKDKVTKPAASETGNL